MKSANANEVTPATTLNFPVDDSKAVQANVKQLFVHLRDVKGPKLCAGDAVTFKLGE
jgi:hypothetical protein